jgi:hypothetical protein
MWVFLIVGMGFLDAGFGEVAEVRVGMRFG